MAEVQKHRAIKCVLLSDSSVKKSELPLTLIRGDDWRNSGVTIGAAFLTDNFDLGNDETVKLEIWDTAGQDRYTTLAPMYLRGAEMAIAVFSVTAPGSFERIEEWLNLLIRMGQEGMTILLVGFKNQLTASAFRNLIGSNQSLVSTVDGEFIACSKGCHTYTEIPAMERKVIRPMFEDGVREVMKRRKGLSFVVHENSNNISFNELQALCFRGDVDSVISSLKQKEKDALTVKTYDKGESLLHLAARAGNEEIVQFLYLNPDFDNKMLDFSGISAEDSIYTNGVTGALKRVINDRTHSSSKAELAEKFVSLVSPFDPRISMKHVLLLSTNFFLSMGHFPHHDECAGHFITGDQVGTDQKVLFISHRWERQQFPDDESNTQYNISKEFIQNHPDGVKFDFIWVDYASICQDKASETFLLNLTNIPTAVFLATHVLIVPKKQTLGNESSEGVRSDGEGTPNSATCTDLADYSGRGWCQLESLLTCVTACTTHVAFAAFGRTEFLLLGGGSQVLTAAADRAWRLWAEPQAGNSGGGGEQGGEEQGGGLGSGEQGEGGEGGGGRARRLAQEWWGKVYVEPRAVLGAGVLALRDAPEALLRKVYANALGPEDLEEAGAAGGGSGGGGGGGEGGAAALRRAHAAIGELTDDNDRLLILRVLLCSLAFCMGYFSGYRPPPPPAIANPVDRSSPPPLQPIPIPSSSRRCVCCRVM